MTTRNVLLTAAAALSAMLGLGVLVRTTEATVNRDLHLVERATTDAVTDTGAAGDSAGDILTFANEVFDKDNAKKVGTNNGWCVRTAVGKAWECFWTLSLDDGQITVEGPFYDGGDSQLAVTGGTGAFASARGQMDLHARNDKGTEYDFVYVVTIEE